MDGGDLPDREGERVKLWAKTPPESFWVVKGRVCEVLSGYMKT